MQVNGKEFVKKFRVLLTLIMLVIGVMAQQAVGTLRGQVRDELGGVIPGATVTLVSATLVEKSTVTDQGGIFTFNGVAPGAYTLRVSAKGFSAHQEDAFEISAGQHKQLDVKLTATIEEQKVTVRDNVRGSTEPDNNATGLVISGEALDALPQDPEELATVLRAMAGASAGPNGVEFYVDGFSSGTVPPSRTIREIRINRNPFSAEFDRMGFGRVDIVTRVGANAYHGGLDLTFNNQSLNTRSPFSPDRPPFRVFNYGGQLGGPLIKNKSSFFVSYYGREISDNALINAIILDPSLNIVPFSEAAPTKYRYSYLAPRVDAQLNPNNTLLINYLYVRTHRDNAGIGELSLPSQAYESVNSEQTFRVGLTSVLNIRTINEVRFLYTRSNRSLNADNSIPGITVLEAFVGGGPQSGNTTFRSNRWDIYDYLTATHGQHVLRFGGRARGIKITDISPTNFGGMFTFAGGPGPQLDADNRIVRDANGNPVLTTVSSIERYRRTLLFQQQGRSPSEILELGGGATQLTIAGGDPKADVKQADYSGFIQDDWRLRPDFTLSLGLRYENQTNMSSNLNIAPRIGFAWSPWKKGSPMAGTVIRGGTGIFYTRFSEGFTLQANRFNGITEQSFIVTDPQILGLFPNVPPLGLIPGSSADQTIRRIATDLTAPYAINSVLSVEKELPFNISASVAYIHTRYLHLLRSRNINAPLPGTFNPDVPGSGIRPFGDVGNIFSYESSGVLNQHQLVVNASAVIARRVNFFLTYGYDNAKSDSDGAGSFPANSYDLSTEYGRSSLDVRHRLTLGGSINLPMDMRISPLVYIRSGVPFNIITGRDSNGDSLFTERPAFATDLNKKSVVITRFGAFDLEPGPGQPIIPRNFGEGPGYVGIDLFVSKAIGFGAAPRPAANAAQASGQAGGGRAPAAEKPYRIIFSVFARNVINHTNRSIPIGNLSSPLFGTSIAPGLPGQDFTFATVPLGNRRIDLGITFSF
jgi:Carboxypeptidase regulatory-like domain